MVRRTYLYHRNMDVIARDGPSPSTGPPIQQPALGGGNCSCLRQSQRAAAACRVLEDVMVGHVYPDEAW